MEKIIKYQNHDINYNISGKGNTIVLLHGYLENLDIWSYTHKELSEDFQVISVDLPGHGKSGVWSNIHTMEFMADVVNFVLDSESITKAAMFGHSMGGYVTLAFANKYHQKLSAISIVHSSSRPDSEEKKENRNREIELIDKGKFDTICNMAIPNLFSNENAESFSKKIDEMKTVALNMNIEGVKAALRGMQLRKDNIEFLKSVDIPKMVIQGSHDNLIPFLENDPIVPLNANRLILKNSGHMGLIEEKETTTKEIKKFVISSIKS